MGGNIMTTSLELSKQLYEKGFRIDTERTYCDISGQWREEKPHFILYESDIAKARQQNKSKELQYPAPSTDELLAVMPRTISLQNNKDEWAVYFINKRHKEANKSIPEALGIMCLWLLENGCHYNPETKMIEREK